MNSSTALNELGICAVVPAAGRGTRLAAGVPKVFVPILPSFTIWDALHEKLVSVADQVVLVLSPEGLAFVEAESAGFRKECFSKTTLALQPEPLGMGDAIFGVADLWKDFEALLIIWGDQYNLSLGTLQTCVELHMKSETPALTLPLVRVDQPYVEYVFDPDGVLRAVQQTREGDTCRPGGFADMGTFLLTGGPLLVEEWRRFCSLNQRGSVTKEVNFLPFLVHLSAVAGWPVNRVESHKPEEALGINTPEDLARAREILGNIAGEERP